MEMNKITPAIIYQIAPTAKPEYVEAMVKLWPSLSVKYGLTAADTPHSLAHIAAETGGYNRLEESLYYTTVARIRAVWPSRFKSDAAALPFIRQPQKLANSVYGGRYGNTAPDDGWRYRGSGCKQTTFKANYQAVQSATGLKCVQYPELLRSFPDALESALVYWRDKGLSKIVAAGGDVVAKLTKAIQGGTGGLADRRTYTARALTAMSATTPRPAPAAKPATGLLQHGSTGAQVKALQTRLAQLGYVSVGNADGKFGDATEDALKLFQADHGLVADGIVGNKTVIALNNAKPTDHKASPLPQRSGLGNFTAWLAGLFRSK